MGHGDIDIVAAIEKASNPDPWSRGLLAGELDLAEDQRWWSVAEIDHEVVGFIGLMFTPTETHVMNVAVAPARRRLGIASLLVAEAVAEAAARERSELTLEVRVSNEAAVALYEAFGFIQEGRRPRYYPDGEDALILWRR